MRRFIVRLLDFVFGPENKEIQYIFKLDPDYEYIVVLSEDTSNEDIDALKSAFDKKNKDGYIFVLTDKPIQVVRIA